MRPIAFWEMRRKQPKRPASGMRLAAALPAIWARQENCNHDRADYRDAWEDESSRLLKKILSPAEAQSLVLPPPDHAPRSGPGESTPLTGNLAKAALAGDPVAGPRLRRRHAGTPGAGRILRRGTLCQGGPPDRSGDPLYIKVSSKGQVGYLPKANLQAARQIDRNLKVLDEA